jgi:hypothetical protein
MKANGFLTKSALFAGVLTALNLGFAHRLNAQPQTDMREGWDVQSPQEIEKARLQIQKLFGDQKPRTLSASERQEILDRYGYLDPKHEVPTDLLRKTVLYFDANRSKLPNQNYITIVDFKPRSDRYRFFLIDMKTGAVERYHTTHGIHSDLDNDGYAESFGNVINSGKSSLGFVRTAEVYEGHYKRAVRLDGLSSTNSNIRARAIVLHGWDGVHEANVIQGLSWGCITLDWAVKDSVIDKVKEGSLMYVGVSAGQ